MDIKKSRAVHPRQRVYRSPHLKVDARDVQMRSTPTPPQPVFVPRSVVSSQPPIEERITPVVITPMTQATHQVALKTAIVAREPLEKPALHIQAPPHHAVRPKRHKFTRKQRKHSTDQVSEPTSKKRRDVRIMYVAAACVMIVGGVLAYRAYMANVAVEVQVKKMQASDSSMSEQSASLPSDTKPADKNYVQNYKVSPMLPQTLTIKKIGIAARILQVGIDKEGRMDVPKTAYDVAWYNGSSRPGEAGAMVIDGHVQGVGGGAIFTNLKKLIVGDDIKVTRGDGKIFSYSVTKTETIPVSQVDMNKLLVSVDTNKPGLNLITCGGDYDTKSETFNSRTIVYTLQQ